ncbi:glycosyltransferase family 4 protein [Leptothoe sp. PORK10 BA2]|uniref:glycosyltransferase family 4 protein n=1 Tax=Leptothoe sp. PORK10 BA2 TaxID=3110254 RepID=UPI002B21876D|nr:glycosyltransferase family 1 protein [Leptothoe sp. PORK10 BA2]MEA5462703.1 glycosyltransferase family 1 protein [Leptothoe sp. PORK10 BA2]
MHIAIDLQALQSPTSRQRGIGRYTEAVLKELLELDSQTKYSVFSNSQIEALDFPVNPKYDSHSIAYPTPYETDINSLILKTTLLSKDVDAYFIPSPMEGLDSVIPRFQNFSKRIYTICYDLIPLIFPDTYWSIPGFRDHYLNRLKNITNSDFIFAISEATRQDAIKYLNISPDKIVNISGGVSSFFRPLDELEFHQWNEHFREKFNIKKPFVMYAGGEDWRKNIDGLIRSFADLPKRLQEKYDLVIACKLSASFCKSIESLASQLGIRSSLIITNYVSDEELRALYSTCYLFVFPSFYEGFGLPALEAMSCGAPTIGSSCSSVPEVIGSQDQLFDPHQPNEITTRMCSVLDDSHFHLTLKDRSLKQANSFTWKSVAQKISDVFSEQQPVSRYSVSFSRIPRDFQKTKIAYFKYLPTNKKRDLTQQLLELLSPNYDTDLFYDQVGNQAHSELDGTSYKISNFEGRLANNLYELLIYEIDGGHLSDEMLDNLKIYPGIIFLVNIKGIDLDNLALIVNRSLQTVVFCKDIYNVISRKFNFSENQILFCELGLSAANPKNFSDVLSKKIVFAKEKKKKQVIDYVGRECAKIPLSTQENLRQLGRIILEA